MPRSKSNQKTAAARAKRRGAQAATVSNTPRKPRREVRPHRQRTVVLHAIKGSRGLWGELAERLGCCIHALQAALRQPGWEDVRQRFEEERLRALDGCARNVFDLANQAEEESIRLRANTFILERLHPDFQQRVQLDGGSPLQVRHVVVQIPAEVMDLPVEARVRVLEAAEEQEGE